MTRQKVREMLFATAWEWGKQALSHTLTLGMVCGALWWVVSPRFTTIASVYAQEQAQVVVDKAVPPGMLDNLAKQQRSTARLLGFITCAQLRGLVRPGSAGLMCGFPTGEAFPLDNPDAMLDAASAAGGP